jgi:bifunctional non-homologous end joining protein LigD
MTSALDRLPPQARTRLRPREQPAWTAPMLAVLTNQRFSDPGWIFERKLDGERCLAFRRAGRLRLLSRTRQPLHDTARGEHRNEKSRLLVGMGLGAADGRQRSLRRPVQEVAVGFGSAGGAGQPR